MNNRLYFQNQSVSIENENKTSIDNPGVSSYSKRVEEEILRYQNIENIHDLPAAFHHIANGYLPKIIKDITGSDNLKDFFVAEIRKHALQKQEKIRIASIGSGSCDEEIDLCQRLNLGDRVVFDCYEINPTLIERGISKSGTLGIKMNFFEQDFNKINFITQYDGFFASHSLHHVVNLENLFEAVNNSGKYGYFFLINDMIGRNGHMSWDRAQTFLQSFWRTIPEQLKWNSFFKKIDYELPNFDCSKEGFEGIRAQDVLPLLIENFKFEIFVPFFSFINRIIDRTYGHNYKVESGSSENHIALLEHLWYTDELFLTQKYLPPTQMLAKVVDPRLDNVPFRSRIYKDVREACYWNYLDNSQAERDIFEENKISSAKRPLDSSTISTVASNQTTANFTDALIKASVKFDSGESGLDLDQFSDATLGKLSIEYIRHSTVDDLVCVVTILPAKSFSYNDACCLSVFCNDKRIEKITLCADQTRSQILVPIPFDQTGTIEIFFKYDVFEVPENLTVISPSSRFPLQVSVEKFDRKFSIYQSLESRMVWIFGSARSGSSWLSEILCSNHRSRPMDETLIGAFLGTFDWAPERVIEAGRQPHHFATSVLSKDSITQVINPSFPPFSRFLTSEYFRFQAAFSHKTRDSFINSIRHLILNQIIVEWGITGYDKIVMKCPNESHASDLLSLCFPKSRLIFLVRDGRDVLASRFSSFASKAMCQFDTEKRQSCIAYYSHFWNFQTDITLSAFNNYSSSSRLLIRYEDLRIDLFTVLCKIFEFVGYQDTEVEIASLSEAMVFEKLSESQVGDDKPRRKAKLGSYRDSFSEAEIRLMNQIMADNLARFGYPVAS